MFALTGAFVGVTLAWILFGLFTPGDFFAGGRVIVGPVVLGAGGLGSWLGARAGSTAPRVTIVVLALLCILFWVAAPDGWWASRPPRPGASRPR